MRITLFYTMITFGCGIGGLGFWASVFWPISVGEIIAATYKHHVEGGE